MASYERMENQFGDAKRAVSYLPKNMRVRQLSGPENFLQAAAQGLQAGIAPKVPAATTAEKAADTDAAKGAVSIDIPYIPIAIGISVVVGAFFLLKKKK